MPGESARPVRRRRFLKSSGAIAAGTAIAAVDGRLKGSRTAPGGCDAGPGTPVVVPDPEPYRVDDGRYRRFSAANTCLGLLQEGPTEDAFLMLSRRTPDRVRVGGPGFNLIDAALMDASLYVGNTLPASGCAFDYRRNASDYAFPEAEPSTLFGLPRLRVRDRARMSRVIKRAASFLGADLAGVASLDRRWLYSEVWLTSERRAVPLELPERYQFAVVLAFEVDYEALTASPSLIATASMARGYSRMASTVFALARFIRNLGYHAIACGNDTALSVPLAIDAGLGELSRPGLLVTPSFGPRIRLAKVLTDLPLQPDRPIRFGVREFCRKCRKCARLCPAGCIPADTDPTWAGPSRANNPGALKWYVDVEKCLALWIENGSDCAVCVAACPYSGKDDPRPVSPRNAARFWEGPG